MQQLLINFFRLMFCLFIWVVFMLVLFDGSASKDRREATVGGVGALLTCVFMKYEVDKNIRR